MSAGAETQFTVGSYLEAALPAEDMSSTQSFYQGLGYEVINEQPWGMVTLQREDSRLTLLSKAFHKSIALAYVTKDLEKLMAEFKAASIEIIEDDSKSEPPRIVINDPSGNEIIFYQR